MIDIIFVVPIALLSAGIGVWIYLFFDEKRKEAARQAAYEAQAQAFVRDRLSKVERRVFKLEQTNISRGEVTKRYTVGWTDPRTMTPEQLFKEGDA